MRKLRIALTKGRLEKQTVALFEKMGLDCTELHNKGRRLILPVGDYEAVLAKAADVVTYVEHGVCDIGVVGRDTIVEYGKSFYEVCDLGLENAISALPAKKAHHFTAATMSSESPRNTRMLPVHFSRARVWTSTSSRSRARWSSRRFWICPTRSWISWRPARRCGKTG